MQSYGIGAQIPDCAVPGDLEAVVSLERQIVDLSEAHLMDDSYTAFAACQIDATREASAMTHLDTSDVGDVMIRQDQLLGNPASGGSSSMVDASLVRTMVAFTPVFRSEIVFRAPTDLVDAAALPLERVPHALMGLYRLAQLAGAAGMPSITFQTLSKLFEDFEPLIRLLAFADCPMRWTPGARIDLRTPEDAQFQLPFIRIAKGLAREENGRQDVALSDLIAEHNRLEDHQRILFLKFLSRRLRGKIMPIHASQSKRTMRGSFRTVVARWMLRHLSEQQIQAAANRGKGMTAVPGA
jgi:hypothetical protein